MKYSRILLAVAGQVWAMRPEKLAAMMDFLRFAANGGKWSPDQVAEKIDGRTDSAIARRAGAVAVLPIVGIISHRMGMMDISSPGFAIDRFRQQFNAAVSDDSIKAIVLDVESPGGTSSGVAEMAAEIYAARDTKPVVAVVNTMACSAGYWMAAAATEVVASPGSDTGSIGVYTLHEDISKLLETEGVKETFITAGKYKVEGNPFEPLGDEARQFLQKRVDETYDQFVTDLGRYRKRPASAVRSGFGEGRTFGAEEALERGMVDRVGTLNETLARFGVGPLAKPDAASGSSGRGARKARQLRHELDAKYC